MGVDGSVSLRKKVGVGPVYKAVHQAVLKSGVSAIAAPQGGTAISMGLDGCGGSTGCAQATVSPRLPVLSIALEVALPGSVGVDGGAVKDPGVNELIAEGSGIGGCTGRLIVCANCAQVAGLAAAVLAAGKRHGFCLNASGQRRFPRGGN